MEEARRHTGTSAASGSFERSFPVPDDIDVDKIDASFKKGVLSVTLPKSPEAQKAEKKIAVKSPKLHPSAVPNAAAIRDLLPPRNGQD